MRALAAALSLALLLLLGYLWATSGREDNLCGRSLEVEMSYLPIDVVYTWVNGSDPQQREALHAARLRHLGVDAKETEVAQDSRYVDNEELRFSLRSLEKFAPWVRKVFLVTNGQVPRWLDTSHPKIVLVKHTDIFANHSHLPTFSSPAIEANLHRIPGLSRNFLYLNDDTMFGAPVWPSDFITPSHGQKVFLSWSVPNCNEGCPPNWIGDGYCDQQCNVSACDWDGPDCVNATGGAFTVNAQHWFQGGNPGAGGMFGNVAQYCARGCPSSWIGDKYCDRACKVPECAMDAGDCGMDVLQEMVFGTMAYSDQTVHIPPGKEAFFLNLTEVVSMGGHITDGTHDHDELVRTATISQQHKIIILTLHANETRQIISIALAWDQGEEKLNATVRVEVGGVLTTSSSSLEATTMETSSNATAATLAPTTRAPTLLSASRRLLAVSLDGDHEDARPLHPMGTGERIGSDAYPWLRTSFASRHLMDVYGDSLKYVNSLFNRHFSNEARKVPAHMPHFIQLSVLERLVASFPEQWDATSSHAFRASDDMQFAFSYFYYLINERRSWHWPTVFKTIDTDDSHVLDVNEFRTLWLVMHDPPIHENEMHSKWMSLSENETIPVRAETIEASSLFEKLRKAHTSLGRNPNEIKDTEEVGFVMIRNNDTSLVERLDGIRKRRHKHICLNDNLHHDAEDTPRVKKIVLDFYNSLLPVRSSFEVDPQPVRTKALAVWSAVIISTFAMCFVAAFVARQRKRKAN